MGLHGRYAQGVAHLRGIVAVVVIQLHALYHAGQLKAAVSACKFVQRPAGDRHIRPQLMSAAQRCQRIGHLEETGHLQLNMAQFFAAEGQIVFPAAQLAVAQVGRPVIAAFAEAEGVMTAAELFQLFHHPGIVAVADGQTVRLRQQGQKLAEGLLNIVNILIKIQMIFLDIRHHRHRGPQVQEAGVELAGLSQKSMAFADAGAAADEVQIAPDMNGGILAALHQHLTEHGRGGGLAVGSAHADSGFIAFHQLAQQRGPFDGGNAKPLRFHPLRVVGQDGHGIDHQIGPVNVFRPVANGHGNVQFLPQVPGSVGFQIVRAGQPVSLFQQHLGQAAHAGAADADHVDMLSLIIPDMRCAHRWCLSSPVAARFRPGKDGPLLASFVRPDRNAICIQFIIRWNRPMYQ